MNALLALAFAAGMLAPVNPCGFVLLPAWIAHTLGDTDTSPVPVRLARALRTGLALTLGFAGTLAAAGLAISAGARALITAAPWLGLGIGMVLIGVGAVMLTGRSLGIRLPARAQASRGSTTALGMVLAGVGYAAASLSCTFGVLLAVIAHAQATTGYGGLVAVFAAYAAGAGTVLLLVCLATAAGVALTRRITALARYGTRIAAAVLVLTGAYLAWYWYPIAASGATTGSGDRLGRISATATTWLQNHTGLIATLAAAAVLATLAVAVARPRFARRRSRVASTETPSADCCATDTTDRDSPEVTTSRTR